MSAADAPGRAALIEAVASTREALEALTAHLELVAAELRKATRALEALRAEAGAAPVEFVRHVTDGIVLREAAEQAELALGAGIKVDDMSRAMDSVRAAHEALSSTGRPRRAAEKESADG